MCRLDSKSTCYIVTSEKHKLLIPPIQNAVNIKLRSARFLHFLMVMLYGINKESHLKSYQRIDHLYKVQCGIYFEYGERTEL